MWFLSVLNNFIIVLFVMFFNVIAFGQGMLSDADVDEQALKEVEKFLNSPAERKQFSETRSDAKAANNFLEGFPQYAQDEIIQINMMILRESKGGAVKHVDAMRSGGAQVAKNSFSPAVKQRIDALVKRLENDSQFNSPANIDRLKILMPSMPGS